MDYQRALQAVKDMEATNYPFGGKIDVTGANNTVFFNTCNSLPFGEEVVARFDGWNGWTDAQGNRLSRDDVAGMIESFGGWDV